MLRPSLRRLSSSCFQFQNLCPGDVQQQREALRSRIHRHDAAVKTNSIAKQHLSSTYAADEVVYLDQYQLMILPSVHGGSDHRRQVRKGLVQCGVVAEGQRHLLQQWQSKPERRVVIFGCNSRSYLHRQLTTDADHTFLIIDPSLRNLANAAAGLPEAERSRVSFLRCESMFACLEVLEPSSVDLVVVPMPTPFWLKSNSYQRLVHCDFLCATHRVLKQRDGPSDPRGVVLFTDCEAYAAFMMEHLEESKLIVQWTRKNPSQLYQRWLPLNGGAGAAVEATSTASPPVKEFTKQRLHEVVAVAASKSGPTTTDALQLMEQYDYARRYYRQLEEASSTTDERTR